MEDRLNFGQALEALKRGKCVARTGWYKKGWFIVKQLPSIINKEIVPKMQALPPSAKVILAERFADVDEQTDDIYYNNQIIIFKSSNLIDSWIPSISDLFSEDWYVVKNNEKEEY